MSSAVFYHLQAISLKKFYLKNLTFTEMVYKFHGQAYVPEDEVVRIFDEQRWVLKKNFCLNSEAKLATIDRNS